MKHRILITGINGFVGRQITKELASQQDIEIMGFDCNKMNFFGESVVIKQVNLLEKDKLNEVISAFNPTSIIHLAAIASPVYDNIGELYDINVRGTENLLDVLYAVCKPNTRVVLTSTAGVYGNSNKDFITEDTPYNPENHYSFSKMVMEFISKKYKDKLDIKIIRPFNIIGVGQNENFLVPKLVKAFTSKQPILRVGNMETYRDFVDINFAAKVFCKAALTPYMTDDVLNICAGHGTRGKDILQTLQELTEYSPEIQVNPEFIRKNEIMRLVGDPTKCNSFIGSEIKTKPVREILAEMVQVYQKGAN